MKIQDITQDDVLSVYSGKNGKCCCGCSGKHTYNPNHQEEASTDRGYQVSADECNKGTITRILNIIKANEQNAETDTIGHIAVVIGTRLYIVYLRDKVTKIER